MLGSLAFCSRIDPFSFETAGGCSASFALLAAVFSEKLNPGLDGVVAGFVVGGAIFFSGSFAPSSSTRRSFEGRNGLSSASTADDCVSPAVEEAATGCVEAAPE